MGYYSDSPTITIPILKIHRVPMQESEILSHGLPFNKGRNSHSRYMSCLMIVDLTDLISLFISSKIDIICMQNVIHCIPFSSAKAGPTISRNLFIV